MKEFWRELVEYIDARGGTKDKDGVLKGKELDLLKDVLSTMSTQKFTYNNAFNHGEKFQEEYIHSLERGVQVLNDGDMAQLGEFDQRVHPLARARTHTLIHS